MLKQVVLTVTTALNGQSMPIRPSPNHTEMHEQVAFTKTSLGTAILVFEAPKIFFNGCPYWL
jgi:hypothetical protein